MWVGVVSLCVCVSACTWVYVCRVSVRASACEYLHAHVRACLLPPVFACIRMCARAPVCVCVYIRAPARAHFTTSHEVSASEPTPIPLLFSSLAIKTQEDVNPLQRLAPDYHVAAKSAKRMLMKPAFYEATDGRQ